MKIVTYRSVIKYRN